MCKPISDTDVLHTLYRILGKIFNLEIYIHRVGLNTCAYSLFVHRLSLQIPQSTFFMQIHLLLLFLSFFLEKNF